VGQIPLHTLGGCRHWRIVDSRTRIEATQDMSPQTKPAGDRSKSIFSGVFALHQAIPWGRFPSGWMRITIAVLLLLTTAVIHMQRVSIPKKTIASTALQNGKRSSNSDHDAWGRTWQDVVKVTDTQVPAREQLGPTHLCNRAGECLLERNIARSPMKEGDHAA